MSNTKKNKLPAVKESGYRIKEYWEHGSTLFLPQEKGTWGWKSLVGTNETCDTFDDAATIIKLHHGRLLKMAKRKEIIYHAFSVS